MAIDVTNFHRINATDTCAVWNILSSTTLYQTAKQANVSFCITPFIQYECVIKKRSRVKPEDLELQKRFLRCSQSGDFTLCQVQLEDLLIPALLRDGGRIGKGEVSVIALAYRTRQAVLTDDQRARRVAADSAVSVVVQTTPHLLGWLVFTGHLLDNDVKLVSEEHKRMGGPLEKFFQEVNMHALRARCLLSQNDG